MQLVSQDNKLVKNLSKMLSQSKLLKKKSVIIMVVSFNVNNALSLSNLLRYRVYNSRIKEKARMLNLK